MTGVEETLRRLAELAARGSKEREISELARATTPNGYSRHQERSVVETLTKIVRDRHPWVPDPVEAETMTTASALLEQGGLDGDELCVLLGALLTAEGIPCRISARKYKDSFVHPVLHWQDHQGAWRLIDPSSTPAREVEHDAKMSAELTVPIRRVP